MSYITVNVHYENGRTAKYSGENSKHNYWNIGYRFLYDTGVYSDSKMPIRNGYFEVVEKSEDGVDVWVEHYG